MSAIYSQNHGRRRGRNKINAQKLLIFFVILLGFLYVQVSLWILKGSGITSDSNSNSKNDDPKSKKRDLAGPPPQLSNPKAFPTGPPKRKYSDWRNLAVELAGKPPKETLRILKEEDPFGVRSFEKRLLENESSRKRFMEVDELRDLFPCPSERITLPDQRQTDKARAFRNGTEPYFLFFQHLRKAGGTNFCALAESNLKQKEIPRYYCMPDYYWDMEDRGAGYLTKYSNDVIIKNMKRKGHKIAGNEWDPFDPDRFFDLPATFATSFRRPLDRALSQFRFECIEDRGCRIKNVTKWWGNAKQRLTNVYTWTFTQHSVRKCTIGTTLAASQERQELIGRALDTVARFNLVMVMEWLAYAPKHVRDVLGFQNTGALTERIRPHIGQAKREDGQEHNDMGAAGIAKASWTPEKYLPPKTYEVMSKDLALDEILTDAARRMFLERIVCTDVGRFD